MTAGSDDIAVTKIRDSRDEIDIRVGTIKAPRNVKSYVLFVNGRTEWIEKYDYLYRELDLPDDVGLVTWDHRGQGASGGARAYVEDYADYARDAESVVRQFCEGKPYSILAHSMGALVSLHASLTGHLNPTRMVLSSPLFGMPNSPVPRTIAKPLSKVLHRLNLGAVSSGAGSHTRKAFELNKLTHDYDLFVRMKEGPYKIPGATYGWVDASYRAIDVVFKSDRLGLLKAPVLVMGGTEERVVEPSAFRKWVQAAGVHAKAEIKLRMIPGGRHELFSEIPQIRSRAVAAARQFLFEG